MSNKYVRSFVTTMTVFLIGAAALRVLDMAFKWLYRAELLNAALIAMTVGTLFGAVWFCVHAWQNQ